MMTWVLSFTRPVAPYTGAWIETRIRRRNGRMGEVAPYTGAWIETVLRMYLQ